jgi:hypothetical protein
MLALPRVPSAGEVGVEREQLDAVLDGQGRPMLLADEVAAQAGGLEQLRDLVVVPRGPVDRVDQDVEIDPSTCPLVLPNELLVLQLAASRRA